MPRARPGARKTDARRRIFRYRTKWTHLVIPRRFKVLLDDMTDDWEDEEKGNAPVFVGCEEPTMAELETKGVPKAEWPYYLGYMKRMLALYRAYTGETLQLEKTNLIEEYVLRGKDRDVLEQVQEVAAECAGVPPVPPFTCEDVRACLEGDYSTWAYKWKVSFDESEGYQHELLAVDESLAKVFIIDANDGFLTVRVLSNGSVDSITDILRRMTSYNSGSCRSVLATYFVYVVNEGGAPKLKIFKDCSLIQTIDLSQLPISWAGTTHDYTATISLNGKYILVSSYSEDEYVLFEGS